MAADEEKLVDSQESEAKVAKRSSEALERRKSPEKSKADIKRDEADLARKGEAAERKIKHELEKKESDLARKQEQGEKKAEKAPERKQPKVAYTKPEQKRAYKRELKKIQAQLPTGSRAFSKVVHNPVVERVSNAAEKTVLRPSVLIGGALVGIGVGLLVYLGARMYGYLIPNWMLLFLLVLGGLLGLLIELILKIGGKKVSS